MSVSFSATSMPPHAGGTGLPSLDLQISILNERRLSTSLSLLDNTATFCAPIHSHFSCMTTTITRVIAKITDNGELDIPANAWAELRTIAAEEFGATVKLHDHDLAGAFHGRPYVPFAHYLVEVTIDEDEVDNFVQRVEPVIDAIIDSHTQQVAIPAER